MAKQFNGLEPEHQNFIKAQHIFFVGSAAESGRVNVSPKGGDDLRVLGPNRIVWRNLTGSGNETAGHLKRVNRMTIMWCAFTAKPLILRVYGQAQAVHPLYTDCTDIDALFAPHAGTRQYYDMTIDLVQTSCGYAVPLMEFKADRDTLDRWTTDRGPEGIKAYWQEKNTRTIDGFPTDIESGA